jgi:hypothetical protein
MAVHTPRRMPGHAGTAPPRPGALGMKLLLAVALSATLAVGAAQPLATLFLLLEAVCAALAGLSLLLALVQHEPLHLRAYGYWHEAAALGVAGLASHLVLLALS